MEKIHNIYKLLKHFCDKNILIVLFLSLISNVLQTFLLAIIPLLGFFYVGKSFNSEENFVLNKVASITDLEINFLNISLITVVIVILSTLTSLLYLIRSTNISFEAAKKIQNSTFKYFLIQPYSFFQNSNKNDLLNQAITDAIRIPNGIFIPFFNIVNSIVLALIIFLSLIILNPILMVVVTLILISIYYFLFQRVKFKLKNFSNLLTEVNIKFIQIGNFIFGLNKDIKHYKKENYFLGKIEENAEKQKKIRTFLNIISLSPRILIEGMVILGMISFIIFSIKNNLFSQEIILEFFIFILFTLRVMPHVQLIFSQISAIESNYTVLNNINKLKRNFKFDNFSNGKFEKNIKLKNINFSYNKNIIFKQLNLKIFKGDNIAILGPNGSGKTTLINLLSGFLKPQSGIVKIDEQKNLKPIYNYFGTITSNPIMLEGSLYENICLSNELDKPTKNKINKILVDLGMEGLLLRYSSKDQNISKKLSQGETQAISIARFLYFEKPIIIIDEGTSNLRTELEKKLIKKIRKISNKITILFITHRFSNLKMFDKVYEIKNKKLVRISLKNRIL